VGEGGGEKKLRRRRQIGRKVCQNKKRKDRGCHEREKERKLMWGERDRRTQSKGQTGQKKRLSIGGVRESSEMREGQRVKPAK